MLVQNLYRERQSRMCCSRYFVLSRSNTSQLLHPGRSRYIKSELDNNNNNNNNTRLTVLFRDNPCLQCFDAVGWAAGRASGL